MRIILIITDYGSFNNFLGDLAIRLIRDGHEVSVITSKLRVIDIEDKFDYKGEGVRFFYVNFPRGFNPFSHYHSSIRIRGILEKLAPDLIHIHFTTGIFTTLFTGRLKYRTVGTFHGLGFPVLSGLKKVVFKAVEKFCFNRLDKIYVLNELDYRAARKSTLTVVEKYETLGLGCDLEVFDPTNFSDQQKLILRGELGIQKDDFVFAYTGRFVAFKGYNKVIRAFIEIYDRNPKVKLLLIGGKDNIHPTGLSREETRIMEVCPGIVMIGFSKEVNKYLSITDVFVFPSVKEGMPVCVIEALAMGVPVITADSRGCNEIVRDGHNGYLVDVTGDNWHILSARMSDLIEKKEKMLELRANIQQDRAVYDRNRYVICEMKRYKQLIKNDK